MRRIRLLLVLVSAAVLGLVGLLAWRALEGLAVERAMRHEAVAQRAFDEMERALSRVLQREEDRPFEHYAFYLPGTAERSPLSSALEPFVVGAFQVDPQGRVSTPLEPADEAGARARGDWPPTAAVRAAIGRVQRTAGAVWSQEGADDFRRGQLVGGAAPAGHDQAPGTTRALSGPGVARLDAKEQEADASAEPEEQSLSDALQAFNRGVEDRSKRRQKVVTAPRSVAEPMAESFALESEKADRSAGFGEVGKRAAAAAPEPVAGDLEPKRRLRENAPLRIAIDPMVGLAVGDDTLVLYRTVLVGQHGYRQGLVLDRPRLAEWLEQSVIGPSGLAGVAQLSFEAAEPAPKDERYVFAHRFAEPFDALSAKLLLAPLPGVGHPWPAYALVGLLLLVGAAGLVGLHHTASVALHYAERRSRFVAAVTHELKTPLTAIRMYAEMLRDGVVPSEAKRHEYSATITDESERLSRLVDNVLEFSRLESGRREIAPVVGDAVSVLEEAVEKLRAHAEREGFRLEIVASPELPAVRFDRDALLQVLFNLVDNAMKYAREAPQKVVRLEARREGEQVALAVRDFGPGVARGHLERIFEPFYRAEDERTRTHRGTGIGLALVKELAERMGASVAGGNAEGGGFRVRLVFPAASATA